MRRCQTFWQCWSFQMLLNPVTLSLWHAPALRSLTPRFAWRPRQRSATPCAPCRQGGSGQSRCSAGPARTAWRSRTGSGGWRAATPPGPAAAGTSWPSPANQDGGRLSKASTPIRRCCFVLFFSKTLDSRPWGWGHTGTPSPGSGWWFRSWCWPGWPSSPSRPPGTPCSAPWPRPPAGQRRRLLISFHNHSQQ